MADVVNPQVVDSVTIDNVKAIAGASAEAAALLSKTLANAASILVNDAVASSSRRNNIADIAMAAILKDMTQTNPEEAVSVSRELSASGGTDLASIESQLGSVIATLQVLTKAAQTTPPPTTGT